MTIADAQRTYERWWLGKWCRQARHTDRPFKLVTRVEACGPPSFFVGTVKLTYEDGTWECVNQHDAFRPRKKDIEVQERAE